MLWPSTLDSVFNGQGKANVQFPVLLVNSLGVWLYSFFSWTKHLPDFSLRPYSYFYVLKVTQQPLKTIEASRLDFLLSILQISKKELETRIKNNSYVFSYISFVKGQTGLGCFWDYRWLTHLLYSHSHLFFPLKHRIIIVEFTEGGPFAFNCLSECAWLVLGTSILKR